MIAGAIGLIGLGGPAQAQRCWNTALVESAQIKEFDVMLMVATLRCQKRDVDLSADYNHFVATHRPVLKAVGDELLRELNQTLGGREALKAYDRMGVVMANKYGNGLEGLTCSDFRQIVMEASALPQGKAGLIALAQRAGMDPPLPAPRCAPPATTVTAAAP